MEPVDVWIVPLERTDDEIEAMLATLSPEERERAGDPPRGPRKRRYVARQAALRALLAARTGTAPEDVSFVRGPAGKPALEGGEQVSFSVADSGDLALVAIAGRAVGVDVERVRERPIAARAEALGVERFFERWTALEARGKARGRGLAAGHPGEDVACTALDVGAGYAAALALAADEVHVRLHPY
jgi:4'-phosphopantetheinyl transferase